MSIRKVTADMLHLSLELLPYHGLRLGRMLASASSPGMLAAIPFIVMLNRSHA
jgi:hypothetical protein